MINDNAARKPLTTRRTSTSTSPTSRSKARHMQLWDPQDEVFEVVEGLLDAFEVLEVVEGLQATSDMPANHLNGFLVKKG